MTHPNPASSRIRSMLQHCSGVAAVALVIMAALHFGAGTAAAQGVGLNNATPDASSILDLTATDRGLLIPRMTTAQRDIIAAPATGLLVFQTDGAAGFYYYDGSAWASFAGSGSDWSLTGNAGTTSGTAFIGTTDAQDFDIRTNNIVRARITQQGRLELLTLSNNVSIGEGVGHGYAGVFIGYQAAFKNSVMGGSNIAIGYQALYNCLNPDPFGPIPYSSSNTAVGYRALFSNTTARYNTAYGFQALYSNTTGNYNTALGSNANTSYPSQPNTTYSNTTGLGYDADPSASNTVVIGNTSVTSIGGQVGWSTLSDKRFKTNIRTDEVKGLEFITRLEPVTYNYDIRAQAQWKEENYGAVDSSEWASKYNIEQMRFSGFLAQDVEQVANEVGYKFSGVDAPKNDKDTYGLRYAEFVVPLVKAVQEQQEQIATLHRALERQQQVITALQEK